MAHHLKKSFAALTLALFVLIPTQNIFAQTTQTPPLQDSPRTRYDLMSCPNARAGTVNVRISSSVITAITGTKAEFQSEIYNANNYPLTKVSVLVRIIKVDNNPSFNLEGADIIDEFIAVKDVNIQGRSTVKSAFSWQVPLFAESGKYVALPFIISEQQANMVVGHIFDQPNGTGFSFPIVGQKTSMRFEPLASEINGTSYKPTPQLKKINKFEDASITTTLSNPTAKEMNVPVVWKLYAWNSSGQQNLIEEKTEVVHIDAKSKVKVKYTASNYEHPLYEVVAEAKYKDTKSIIKVEFARLGIDEVDINYLAVDKFPLKAGQETNVFSCLRYFENVSNSPDSKTVITVQDRKGNIIFTKEQVGTLSKDLLYGKNSFIPEKDYDYFTVKLNVFQDNKLIADQSIVYDCKNISEGSCKQGAGDSYRNIIAISILGLCALILIGILLRKRFAKVAIFFFVFAMSMGTYAVVDARSVSGYVSDKVRVELLVPYNDGIPFQYWPCIGAHYTVKVTREDNPNAEFDDISMFGTPPDPAISVGERIKVEFLPDDGQTWWDEGKRITLSMGNSGPNLCLDQYGFPTTGPYLGSWVAGAGYPPGWYDSMTEVYPTHYVGTVMDLPVGPGNPWGWDEYHNFFLTMPFTAEPPSWTLHNITGMTCDPLDPATKSTYCTMTTPGIATISLKLGQTLGRFYFTYQEDLGGGYSPIFPSTPAVFQLVPGDGSMTGGNVVIPEVWAHYDIDVGDTCPGNAAPSLPQISGPTTGLIEQSNDFSFVSTDANNDGVKYLIDWDNDGFADVTVPASGWESQGVSVTASKAWAGVGPHTFKVKASDACGSSAWAEYTITLSEGATALSCSASPNPASLNSTVNWAGIVSPSDTTTYTSWAWTGDITGNSQNVSTTYSSPGTKNGHLVGTHADGTKTADCSVNVSTCTPKSPGCPTSCGAAAGVGTVSEGGGLTTGSALCADGATYTSGSLNPAWSWTCRGPWQNNTESCVASCTPGTSYDALTGSCSSAPQDWCVNIPGLQSDPAPYTIVDGNCVFNAAQIEYFRFNPDIASSQCPAYWDTTLGEGLTMSCMIGNTNVANEHLAGTGANQLFASGKTHTLSCNVYDTESTLVAVLNSRAKCNRLGDVIER